MQDAAKGRFPPTPVTPSGARTASDVSSRSQMMQVAVWWGGDLLKADGEQWQPTAIGSHSVAAGGALGTVVCTTTAAPVAPSRPRSCPSFGW